jgi:hypothetical protein
LPSFMPGQQSARHQRSGRRIPPLHHRLMEPLVGR